MSQSYAKPGARRAILLGLEHPQSAAAVQSLGRAGVPLAGVTSRATRRVGASRYLHEIHRIGTGPGDLLSLLDKLAPEGGVIFPLNDDYLLQVSQNYDQIARAFVSTAPPWSVLGPLVDQRQLYVLARECGLQTPMFFTPKDEAELRDVVARLDLDNEAYLLKTMLGTAHANTDLQRYTRMAGTDRAAIVQNCIEIFERNGEFPMIAQVVPGEVEQCIGVTMVAGHDFRPLLSYAVRRLKLYQSSRGGHPQHPFQVGANTYCETVDDPEAVEAASRLVEHAGFTGPIAVEFRRDPRDNRLVLVKADPRLVGATSFGRSLGLDLPLTTYELFNGGAPEPGPAAPLGRRWLWLTCYADALWAERAHRPPMTELAGLLKRPAALRSLAYWDTRDPLPFVMDLAAWAWIKCRSPLRRGIPALNGPRESKTA